MNLTNEEMRIAIAEACFTGWPDSSMPLPVNAALPTSKRKD